MEESPAISMGRTGKIVRKSVHTFLQNYHFFTSIAAIIALPFSLSVLISQSLIPHSFSLFPTIYTRLHSIFEAAGFPPSSDFFSLLSLKLSQTISSSIITLPFTISFLLISKAAIIHLFNRRHTSLSYVSLYIPLLCTHICNSFVIFAANATCFGLLFLVFNFLDGFGISSSKWLLLFSAVGAVLYSIVLANALVVCNLALISSGMDVGEKKSSGLTAILRACVMIKGKTATALALAVPINLGLAAVEALFYFRIVASHGASSSSERELWLVALEGVLIAYIYSLLLVLDVIMGCLFYQSCKSDQMNIVEDRCNYGSCLEKLKGLEEFV